MVVNKYQQLPHVASSCTCDLMVCPIFKVIFNCIINNYTIIILTLLVNAHATSNVHVCKMCTLATVFASGGPAGLMDEAKEIAGGQSFSGDNSFSVKWYACDPLLK